MDKSIRLFIGWQNDVQEFVFYNRHEWEAVRSQIEAAYQSGRGLITVRRPDANENIYVFSPSLLIKWTNFKS